MVVLVLLDGHFSSSGAGYNQDMFVPGQSILPSVAMCVTSPASNGTATCCIVLVERGQAVHGNDASRVECF